MGFVWFSSETSAARFASGRRSRLGTSGVLLTLRPAGCLRGKGHPEHVRAHQRVHASLTLGGVQTAVGVDLELELTAESGAGCRSGGAPIGRSAPAFGGRDLRD
jgi:hypothetical protein